jgi:hypothetical protein
MSDAKHPRRIDRTSSSTTANCANNQLLKWQRHSESDHCGHPRRKATSIGTAEPSDENFHASTARTLLQTLYGIREREFLDVHRQVDRTSSTLLCTGVIPLGARREDLELAARRTQMPATASDVLYGLVGRIPRIKSSTHGSALEVAQTLPGPLPLLASYRGFGKQKRSLEEIGNRGRTGLPVFPT